MILGHRTFGGLTLAVALSLTLVGCAPKAEKPKGEEAAEKKSQEPSAESAKEEMPATEAAPDLGTPPAGAPSEEKPAEEKPAQPPVEEESSKSSSKVKLGSPELTAGIPGEGPLKIEEIETWINDPRNHETLEVELPLGLAAGASQIQGLDKNPLTRAKIELGRQLYFDPRLSVDVTVSCASCHNPDEGFARHTQFGIGVKGQQGGRNSPVSYNRILSGAQFWDGRAASLEDQAVGPIANPIEMGHTHEACVICLGGVPGYKLQFEKIFGQVDIESVGKALASFERAIVSAPAPFDYYERFRNFEKAGREEFEDDPEQLAKYDEAAAGAKEHPMSDSAKRGRDLFFSEKSNCTACHVGANFTDEKYHNLGVGMDKEKPDIGREDFTGDAKDRGAFKTPTIRNVALSAPYMHDGSQKTLEEVVEWYAKGGHANPNLDAKIKKLDLSDQDKADLVEFMKQGCTSDFPKVERERIPE